MLLRYEGKQMRRTPLRMSAMVLALALMTVLLTVSTALVIATEDALARVDDEYYTVARRNYREREDYGNGKAFLDAQEEFRFAMNRFLEEQDSFESIRLFSEHSGYAAYNESITPLVTSCETNGNYSFRMNKPNNMVVLIVRCISADELDETERRLEGDIPLVNYRMELEEVVLSNSNVQVAEHILMNSALHMSDGSPAFLKGERYLIWGLYDVGTDTVGTLIPIQDISTGENVKQSSAYLHEQENHVNLYIKDKEDKPAAARLGDMTFEEFKQTPAFANWDLPMQIATASVYTLRIFTSNRAGLHLAFMEDEARIVAGRDFTDEDIANGGRVCIVNAELAEKNGLSVGDTIDLSMYITTYFKEELFFNSTVVLQRLYTPGYSENRLPDSGGYTIVGLYEVDHWKEGDQFQLHPNTVLIPDAPLKSYWRLTEYHLETIILPNGGIDAFEAELAEKGYLENMFTYDDQGYSKILPHLNTLRSSTQMLFRLCLGLWVLIVTALIVMYALMQKPMARVKHCVGVSRWRIWGHTLYGGVLVLVCSVLIGTGGGILLYDLVLEKLMGSDFTAFHTAFGSQGDNTEILSQLLTMLQQSPRTLCELGAWQFAIMLGLLVLVSGWLFLRKKSYRN